MAMRNIVKLGDPTLKKHSRTVEKFDDRLAQLIDDMKETMYANDGLPLNGQATVFCAEMEEQ